MLYNTIFIWKFSLGVTLLARVRFSPFRFFEHDGCYGDSWYDAITVPDDNWEADWGNFWVASMSMKTENTGG